MTDVTTIPCLPCVSMAESLDFYRALGFEVTYQQKSPNEYAVVRQGGCELHLFGLNGLKAEEGYSTCLVVLPEVEPLHKAFGEALRQKYGKLPVAGFPRITRFKPGQTRFTLTDPSGNSIICVKRSAPEGEGREKLTGLAKGIGTAAKLRDERGDDESAARVLDVALDRYRDAPALDRARALAARAELAVALGEADRLRALREELQRIPISDEEREKYRHEFEAAEILERGLR
jgi:catechol 2,3-dioxygenase-like lactoylglutathione lyase family enzyme